MIALREIKDVTSDVMTIALPSGFPAKRVEIIVLPVEEPPSQEQKNFQEILLAAPTLTDEELHEFNDVREWMNQWNVNAF